MTARVILCWAVATAIAWALSAAVGLDSWGYVAVGCLAGPIGASAGLLWDERRAA